MVGLGDELQLAASAYNLGYWVRKTWRRKGIALACVDAIFSWQSQRTEQSLIEITVHPHNEAGQRPASQSVTNGMDLQLRVSYRLKLITVRFLMFCI